MNLNTSYGREWQTAQPWTYRINNAVNMAIMSNHCGSTRWKELSDSWIRLSLSSTLTGTLNWINWLDVVVRSLSCTEQPFYIARSSYFWTTFHDRVQLILISTIHFNGGCFQIKYYFPALLFFTLLILPYLFILKYIGIFVYHFLTLGNC